MAKMADSEGMKFARRMLEKYGWEEGKGLGRNEDGITQPVKQSRKMSKQGVGFRAGEEYSNNWWDKAYKRAAENLEVSYSKDKVKLGQKENFNLIKDKSTRPINITDTMDYSSFLKRATLSGNNSVVYDDDFAESSDSDQLPVTAMPKSRTPAMQVSDEDLYSACEGRTAHKGARHGLTQKGKLARLQQQEQEEQMLLNALQEAPTIDGMDGADPTMEGIRRLSAMMSSWRKELLARGVLPRELERSANVVKEKEKKKKKKEVAAVSTEGSEEPCSPKGKTKKKLKKEKEVAAPLYFEEMKVKPKKVKKQLESPDSSTTKKRKEKEQEEGEKVKRHRKAKKLHADAEALAVANGGLSTSTTAKKALKKPAMSSSNAAVNSPRRIREAKVEEGEKKKKSSKKTSKKFALGGAGDGEYTRIQSAGGGEVLVPIPETPDRLKGLQEPIIRRKKTKKGV